MLLKFVCVRQCSDDSGLCQADGARERTLDRTSLDAHQSTSLVSVAVEWLPSVAAVLLAPLAADTHASTSGRLSSRVKLVSYL